jgi:4-hydroxybenzoate polyprenyltransferase
MMNSENFAAKRFSLRGDFFIAVCSFFLFYSFLKNPHPQLVSLALLIGFGSFLYYTFLHSFDHKTASYRLSIIWYLGAMFSIFWLWLLSQTFDFFIWTNFAAALVLLIYQLPHRKFQLRDIPFLKSCLISVFWCYFLVWYPCHLERFMVSDLSMLLIENFFFILSLSLIYDYYDTAQDEKYGLKTLVNFHFKNSAEFIVVGLLILACLPGLTGILFPKYFLFGEFVRISFSTQVLVSVIGGAFWYNKYKIRTNYLFLWDGLILLKSLIIIFVYKFF